MIILASTSPARQRLLRATGIAFDAIAPGVDEAALKARHAPSPPNELALLLAQAKAERVAQSHPDAIVIGCDQLLACNGRLFDKPVTHENALDHLLYLQGRTHTLHTALCCLSPGRPAFTTVSEPNLTMRSLSRSYLEHYLSIAGDGILASVGCYHIEGLGLHLFDTIEGDIFAIQGLPLLPLLAHLRSLGYNTP